MKKLIKPLLLASALAGLSLAGAVPAAADFKLNILHFNDFHARFEPINKFDSTCSPEEEAKGACFGGIARLKAVIDQTRGALATAGENVLLLAAGDEFQGSLYYTTSKSKVVSEFMNTLGLDVAVLGNHEFDDGPSETAKFIDAVNFPVLLGNVELATASPINGKVKGTFVKTVGGEKIGVIGVLATDTGETSSSGPTVKFVNEIETARSAVKALEGQGVNKIILLSHVGYYRDQQIAAAVDGIDVIVGGHSHTLLGKMDGAVGPYPTLVKAPSGVDVPIVTAYAYSRYLGDIVVTFDDRGVVKAASGDPIQLDAKQPQDAALVARVKELGAPLAELKARVIGETTDVLDGNKDICRFQECSMGDVVAEAMLASVKGQGITIAVQNGGGVRASIDKGPVTMGEVLTVLPFQNTIATFRLKGADLVAALENGLSRIEEGAGRFPQVAGLKYVADVGKPAGGRIVSVEVAEEGKFVPLDPEKLYGIVTNNYMRAGGDGYRIFKDKGKDAYDFGPNLEDTVAAYIGARSPLTPKVDGRVVINKTK